MGGGLVFCWMRVSLGLGGFVRRIIYLVLGVFVRRFGFCSFLFILDLCRLYFLVF